MNRKKTPGYELIRESFHRKILPRFAEKNIRRCYKIVYFSSVNT